MGVPLPPPPPPFVSIEERSDINPGGQVIVATFVPAEARCDGMPVSPLRLEAPFPTSTRRFGPPSPPLNAAYRIDFAIDADGRPHSIHRPGATPVAGPYVNTSDLAPALAASRFAPGAAHERCAITYRAQLVSVDAAPMALLYELAATAQSGSVPAEIRTRLRDPDSDCLRGPVSPRTLNYPPFETIDQPAGTRAWTFLSFDVDAKGRTANVRVRGSSGNAALDKASVKALAANRYAPNNPRHGCTFHFYRTGNGNVPAPLLPADAPTDNGELSACAIDPKTIAGLLNGNAFPNAFSRRRIEGFAIVGYDTAPWGATGNVKVIAAEPDEAFGQAARGALINARVAESDSGHRGCVRRIRFVLPVVAGADRASR